MAKSKARPASAHPNDAKWDSVIADMHRLADTFRTGGMAAVEKAFRVTRSTETTLAQPSGNHSVGEPRMRGDLDQLRAEIAAFALRREQAEAKCDQINPVVRQLASARMAEPGLRVVGPSVLEWEHRDSESTTYNCAAVQVPDGVGVVRFDLQWGAILNEDHIREFVPFAGCEPPIQARLTPHIQDSLLGELMIEINRSAAG